jgi:hypothetical protein
MRQCECGRYVPGQPWVDGRDCYICWLYHNEPAYQPILDRPAPEKTSPGAIVNQMVQFADSMITEMAWRAGGGPAPSSQEKAARRRTCDSCDNRDPARDLCTVCGCYLEGNLLHLPPIPLGKLDCATQKCPLGLWGYAGGYAPAEADPCCKG